MVCGQGKDWKENLVVHLPGGTHRWIVLRSIDRDEDRWFGGGSYLFGKAQTRVKPG